MSGFSEDWDGRYKVGTHRSMWPWTDVVSLCERYVRAGISGTKPKILEVGFGYGANIPYLLTLGDYFGIDGSETAVREISDAFPELSDKLRVGDFTKNLGFDYRFDVILDRASITHNDDLSIRRCVDLIHEALEPGGYFVGVTLFGKANAEFTKSEEIVDEHTRKGYVTGQFSGTGNVHFTDEDNLRDILSSFEILFMEHKVVETLVPADASTNAFYNFVAKKK